MAVSQWPTAALFLAGVIIGVAVTSVVMWFLRHRIRAWLSRRGRR